MPMLKSTPAPDPQAYVAALSGWQQLYVQALQAATLAAATVAAAPQHAEGPPRVELGAEEVKVPLEFVGGRPVVAVKLNGKGPYRMYLDTGASGSVLSDKLARELKLPVLGKAGVKAGGDGPDKKPIQAEIVRLDRLDIGAAVVRGARAAAPCAVGRPP